jgi:membrane-associated protease RseP (regulator of RpoE activity)
MALAVSTCAFQPISNGRTLGSRHPNQSHIISKTPSLNRISATRPKFSLNLNPTAALSSISSPLGSLSVLAFVILVHEAGHFIAARSLGIDVDEFSVGVGPRILGVRKKIDGDKASWEWIEDLNKVEDEDMRNDGSIEFSLRALPLGGYVRFPPSYNQTLAFELEDKARKARDDARLLRVEKSNSLEKGLELMAARSVLFNALSLGLLKRWQKAREQMQLRDAEDEAMLEKRDRSGSKSKNWWGALPWNAQNDNTEVESSQSNSAQAIVELIKAGETPEVEYYDSPNLLQNRPWQQRAVVLAGGVAFNILLAFMCYFGEVTVGKGLPRPCFDSGAVVSGVVAAESPAYGVLKQGDIILGVNGR